MTSGYHDCALDRPMIKGKIQKRTGTKAEIQDIEPTLCETLNQVISHNRGGQTSISPHRNGSNILVLCKGGIGSPNFFSPLRHEILSNNSPNVIFTKDTHGGWSRFSPVWRCDTPKIIFNSDNVVFPKIGPILNFNNF